MRRLFPSFYEDDDSNSDSFEHWDEAIFAFDTSALLMIFEYGPELQNNWLTELERLKGKGRLFLPYQVASEYHLQLRKRRKEVITNAEEYFVKPIEEIISTLKKIHQNDRHPLSKEGILTNLVNELVERAEMAEITLVFL
ncbi:MAG: PIN-like domain-containing protein [Cyanobacteriota/Melainabacteria group bacterium]